MIARLLTLADRFAAPRTVHAHCDIPCGVYDPEQARIEAESCYKMVQKYHDSDDALFRDRCVIVKERQAEEAKHHLYVLWSDYFKPEHLDQFPNLHDTLWKATKQASQVKRSMELDDAQKLLDLIDEVDEMWKATGGPETTRKSGRPG
jgi:nickel superoxide dismutase